MPSMMRLSDDDSCALELQTDFAEVLLAFHIEKSLFEFGKSESFIDHRFDLMKLDGFVHLLKHAAGADEDALDTGAEDEE